jgi:hypothetical protein
MKHKTLKLSAFLLFVLGITGLQAQNCGNMMLTKGAFPETVNMQNVVRQEFGHEATVADWEDLKAIPNIQAWIACMRLAREESFFVTRNGNPFFQGKRQYIVQYFPTGKVPAGFLIHDQIDHRLFLGSWYGVKWSILAIKNGGHRDEGHRDLASDWESIKLTHRTFNERQNLEEAVREEFGGKCEIADWNDLKTIPNIVVWASRLNLRPNQTFFITRDGKFNFSLGKQYFVYYSPNGKIPSGFLVQDQIDRKLFLGATHGIDRQIVVRDFRHR